MTELDEVADAQHAIARAALGFSTIDLSYPRFHQLEPRADWCLVPPHCRDGLAAYFETGRKVGDFLTAVLQNDLMLAASYADDHNHAYLVAYAKFLYNYAPTGSYGSREAVEAWQERGGLAGHPEHHLPAADF